MPNKITDICKQKNNDTRFSVFINEQYAFSLSDVELLSASLSVGQTLSESEIEAIRQKSFESKCLDYALRIVQLRMYTEKGLKRKLSEKGYTDTCIAFALEELKRYDYVNDAQYAETYVAEAASKYGSLKIRQKLYEKGVSAEIIDGCLAEIENDDCATRLLQQKMRGRAIEEAEVPKLLRFLAQRGFLYAQAKKAIDSYREGVYNHNAYE